MKIIILSPIYSHCIPYWLSIIKFQAYCGQNNIQLEFIPEINTSHISYARKSLVDKLLKHGNDYDYVLWVDADQSFEPEQVMQLTKHDKDVCCAAIKMVGGTKYAAGWLKGVEAVYMDEVYIPEYIETKVDNPLEIDFLGFGFTLIKKGVIESMDNHFQNDGLKSRMIPEDMAFYFKVKDNGYKMFIDWKCRVLHWKELAF